MTPPNAGRSKKPRAKQRGSGNHAPSKKRPPLIRTTNVEEGVYVCSWKKAGARWHVWLKKDRRIAAESTDLEEAIENLAEAIRGAGGAIMAITEFDPPLPLGKDPRLFRHSLRRIWGDDRFDWDAEERSMKFSTKAALVRRMSEYFEQPVCPRCLRSAGRRNAVSARVGDMETGQDGATGFVCGSSVNWLRIFSEDFLRLLTRAERGRLEFQRVNFLGGRRVFYELVGPSGSPAVGVKGLQPGGWRCGRCRRPWFTFWKREHGFSMALAEADLPSPLPSLFCIGTAPDLNLCVTEARWRQLVGKRGTRGFCSDAVAVVPSGREIREGRLRLNPK